MFTSNHICSVDDSRIIEGKIEKKRKQEIGKSNDNNSEKSRFWTASEVSVYVQIIMPYLHVGHFNDEWN